ncbi:high-affinity iron permease [Coemansia sp. RSA 1722]|nr:high-affinity iron permease [Coemansia sp. RSA 486]KAJ2601117.1 high-affinity iron permease [Coemansia sp. RSA 1721]KAJ2604009.1 high-affinity iron permease [Coemansia sp. RSA 1722]KAJ2635531.1 high-affinity iron permease [Coemansia sp. RSA 1286]
MANVFNVPIFFIVFRETIEAAVIISVLLSFAKQMFSDSSSISYKRARKQIWIGAAVGLFICLVIGGAFIGVFYSLENDLWQKTEALWEAIFCLIAVIMITLMGLGMLRSGRMQDKWRVKLAKAMEEQSEKRGWRKWLDFKIFSKKYLFFHLPFLTVLREGLEAVVFVGGVSLGATAKSIPLAVIIGLLCGALVGYLMYRTGNAMSFHWFFVISTCLLYLIAAGLMSKCVFFFEEHTFSKYAGADPDASGVIDVRVNVWALDYGNPEANDDSGWGIFNAILGWNNVATFGTIISYCLYWFFLAAFIVFTGIREKRIDRRRASFEATDKEAVSSQDTGSDKLHPTIEIK